MKTLYKKSIKRADERGKGIFWSLACLLFVVASFYVYLVNTAAWHGLQWKKAEQEFSALTARVSGLESSYLSLKKSVTLPLAYAMGFEDVRAVRFIGARKVGAVARGNGI